MNRLNKTESVVFIYCRFSLFLKDQFFQIIYRDFNNFHCAMRLSQFSLNITVLFMFLHIMVLRQIKQTTTNVSARGKVC